MIKLRKYFRGHNGIYVHGTAKDKDVTLRGTPDRPEWIREDIVLPKPVSLYRYEWNDVHTGENLAVTFNLSEIEKDGTEYWHDDVEENFAWLQSRIGDYNTELYLKEIDEQGTV